ncbi:MAG TPA: DUF554 domain-containing protein [Armatimonadota bacterium]|nr:DUF554 domain-containing protein [Armatimonadota bacterium]
MVGTLINVGTVVAGAVTGKLIGDRLPPRLRETVMHVIALMTLVLGAGMSLKSQNALILLGALILGGITGELLRIEEGINRLGAWAEARLAEQTAPSSTTGDFSRGFVTTSILFCVGPLTLLGCLRDGLQGDYQLLAMKAMLDGISALAFASVLGWGVLLSAGTVLVVQGALTLAARGLSPLIGDQPMQAELFAAGGVMMLGLGFRLLELRQIRVANLLPALIYAPLLVALTRWRP